MGTNTKLFSGNQALDSGALGFGLGLAASAVVPSLLGGGGCGRRRRSAQNKDGTNTKFFLGNNCGPSYNQPSYPQPVYNQPSYQQPSYNPCGRKKRSPQDANSRHYSSSNCGGSFTSNNNYYNNNNYYGSSSSHHSNNCRCTSLTVWRNGRKEGNCQTSDYGKGAWCYTTGYGGGCRDYHNSKQYPNNPWSYEACRNGYGKK